jgi:tetratricopeptide (TPR) repeat protein
LPFRAVLRTLQAARSGQLAFDFRIDAPTAKILKLGPRPSRPRAEPRERIGAPRPTAGPTVAEDYFLKASALDHDRSTQEEAAAWYRRALEADPYLVAALINLANIHYASDELIEAQALYERAIGLEPDFFEAHFNLGNIYHDLNRYDEAAACYQRALTLNPAYPDTHFYLAVTLEKLGHSADAKPHWRAYQQLAPDGEWVELAREFSE